MAPQRKAKSSAAKKSSESHGASAEQGVSAKTAQPESPKAPASKTSASSEASAQTKRQKAQNTADQSVLVFGRPVSKDKIFRLAGLVAFFAILILVLVLLWPLFGQFFEPGGRARIMEAMQNAGPLGIFILLGIQILQVVVAFIPGEVVQVAAGAMYGPLGGMIIILVGCLIASWLIYEIVHRLGQPFVEAMVPTKYLDKFRSFEETGRLDPLVFTLFLIPGLPKDTFTYLVPLTDMPLKKYLAITTLARIPGVLLSTFAADGFVDGNMRQAVVVVVILAITAGVGFFFKDRIIEILDKR